MRDPGAFLSLRTRELYVSFLVYGVNWARYLRGGAIANAGLATFQRFGPYRVDDNEDMEAFGEVIACILLAV